MSASRLALSLLACVLAVSAGSAGCAECAEATDCSIGEQCVQGSCAPTAGDRLEILSAPDVTTSTFDLTVRVRFQGDVATLRVTRLRGDECVPFVPAQLTLFGDGDQNTEQDVVVAGLSSVGEFELTATLDIGTRQLRASQAFQGPPAGDEFGGARFEAPSTSEVDVVDEPWQSLRASLEGGRVTAFVSPVGGPSTPRVIVAEAQADVDAFVPLVRGPQIVWLESEDRGIVRRCGRGLIGGPVVDDGGALELALLTESAEPAWLGLSARVQQDDGDTICDAVDPPALCQHEVRPLFPTEHNAEVLRLRLTNGVVEVAAVPLVISGPVTARVRITRAGVHEGFFGPFSIFPAEGQAWFAGRVIVEGGRVVGLVPVDDVSLGAPW